MRTVLRVASPGQTCHWAMPRQATIAAIICLIAGLAVTAERAVQQPVVVGTPESVASVKSLVDAPWQELHFAASKLFLQARTMLSLAIATPEEVNAALRPPPTGTAVTAGTGPFALLTVRSELPFGRRDTTRVWLDATRAATLQADRLISGRNPYHKTLRYCTEGIYMWRDAPSTGREAAQGPAAWSKRREHFDPTTPAPSADLAVTDPYAIIPLLSLAAPRQAGTTRTLCTVSDDHLIEIVLTAGQPIMRRVSFSEAWPGGERRREGEQVLRMVQVTGHGVGNAKADRDIDLGFLGLRGSIEVLVEPDSGIPVELSGRADTIGELTIRLERVVLRNPPASPP